MAGFDRNSRHANNMHGLINNHARQEPEPSSGSGSSSFSITGSGILTAATRIACRICGRIFKSDRALFQHMELHLMLDEEDARRKLLLSHMSTTPGTFPGAGVGVGLFDQSPFPLGLSSSTLMPFTGASRFNQSPFPLILPKETNPISFASTNTTRSLDRLLLPAPPSATASPPVAFRSMTNNYMAAPLTPTQLQASTSAAAAAAGYGAVKVVYVPVPQPRSQCFTKPLLNHLEATLLMEGMSSIVGKKVADDDQSLDLKLKL